MIKRLLAFVLTGCLLFETPATAYAAGQWPADMAGNAVTLEADSNSGTEDDASDGGNGGANSSIGAENDVSDGSNSGEDSSIGTEDGGSDGNDSGEDSSIGTGNDASDGSDSGADSSIGPEDDATDGSDGSSDGSIGNEDDISDESGNDINNEDNATGQTNIEDDTVGEKGTSSIDEGAEERHESFSAVISPDFTTLTLSAVLSGYGEEAAEAVLSYEYTDALGRVQGDTDLIFDVAQKGDEKEYTLTEVVDSPAMLAGVTYIVSVKIQFADKNMADVSHDVEVTAPEACYQEDGITFTCVQNSENDGQADYELAWEEGNVPVPENVRIYYRIQGSETSYREVKTAPKAGTAAGSISNLWPGCTYELYIFAGGVKKMCTLELAQSTTGISLVNVAEGDNRTGVYDLTRTIGLKANDGDLLKETYYIHMYYAPKSGEYIPMIVDADNLVLTAENHYQVTVRTADYGEWMHPDTDYSLMWKVTETRGSAFADAVLHENVHTGTAQIEMSVIKSGHATQSYKITMNPDDLGDLQTDNSLWVNLYAYIKKAGDSDYRKDDNEYCQLSAANKYSGELELTNLTEDTEYELSVRDKDNLVEYAHTTFRTQPDYRNLSDVSYLFTALPNSFRMTTTLQARLNGNVEGEETYILFYYKNNEQKWSCRNVVTARGWTTQLCSYDTDSLIRGSTYEYAIVLSSTGVPVNPDMVTREGWKLTGQFTVPPKVPIEKITLSHQEIALNAAFPDEEGYGCQTLKVALEPANATKSISWSSSDKNVATVNQSGVVKAVGAGEAMITVSMQRTSLDEEYVYARCKVRVENYQVRYQESDSAQAVTPEGNRMTLQKNKALGGKLVLYSVNADGTETAVPEAEYKVESGNTGVVLIKDGIPQTKNVGTTRLIYTTKGTGSNASGMAAGKNTGNTANQYRAYITWETLAAGRRFSIVGMKSSDNAYPVLEEKGGYMLVCGHDFRYTAVGELSSAEEFDPALFTWKIRDEQTAAVDENGVITPLAVGETLLTVEPKETGVDGLWAVNEPVSVPIIVVQYPEENKTYYRYTLINTHKTLGEVECPIEGWEWEYPDESLALNGVTNSNYSYYFNAVCRKDGFYPRKRQVIVYVGEVTGMSVSSDDHEGVVEVSGADDEQGDVMTLQIDALCRGTYDPYTRSSDYKDITWTVPKVAGLQITAESVGNGWKEYCYTIKAEKPGTYTLKPSITIKDEKGKTKVLAQTSYKIKAVKDPQAKSIVLTPVTGEGTGITFDQENNRVMVDVTMTGQEGADTAKKVQSFDVEAVVKDRNGEALGTKLTWKSSDKKVAAISVSKDTHRATVSLKGEGHSILTATAVDALGTCAALRVEIQNHAPRVNVSNVKVNTAYDYTQKEGRELAKGFSGVVEILPVYGDEIQSVLLYEKDAADQEKNGLSLYEYGDHQWLVCPDEDMGTGSLKCILRVETKAGSIYEYPLTVALVNQQAKVKVKQEKAVNLFYTNSDVTFRLDVTGGHQGISDVRWQESGEESGKGFGSEAVSRSTRNGYIYISFAQQNLELNRKKRPADTSVLKGTLKVTLKGYKEPCEINTSIKWAYKKPVIVSSVPNSTMSPSSNTLKQSLVFRDKTEGANMYYDPQGRPILSYVSYYHTVTCDSNHVEMSRNSGEIFEYTYTRNKMKGNEKITFTLDAVHWREPLKIVCTIRLSAPKAYLSKSQVVINTSRLGTAFAEICVKDMDLAALSYEDIIITGKNAKAEKLLAEELLEIGHDGNRIIVRPVKDKILSSKNGMVSVLPAGTYAYKIVPYYTDANGVRQAMNALTLKVKISNRAVTAKVRTKGSLDLAGPRPQIGWTNSQNRITLTTVFSNMGTGYTVKEIQLAGNYSGSFNFNPDNKAEGGSMYLLPYGNGLRAGKRYKLYLVYTIEMEDGESFNVTSAPFTVTPKQTVPKVKVTGNNQTLYASADNVSRTYGVETLKYKRDLGEYYFYEIKSVHGSVDCNKDGIPDIEVKDMLGGTTGYGCDLDVRITDRDGVSAVAGVRGKAYTIPITVQLKGRDGISKDVKTSIKVMVKQ